MEKDSIKAPIEVGKFASLLYQVRIPAAKFTALDEVMDECGKLINILEISGDGNKFTDSTGNFLSKACDAILILYPETKDDKAKTVDDKTKLLKGIFAKKERSSFDSKYGRKFCKYLDFLRFLRNAGQHNDTEPPLDTIDAFVAVPSVTQVCQILVKFHQQYQAVIAEKELKEKEKQEKEAKQKLKGSPGVQKDKTSEDPTSHLFVTNLPAHIEKNDLSAIFCQFSDVVSADVKGNVPNRYGFVNFQSVRDCSIAKTALTGQIASNYQVCKYPDTCKACKKK